jgi:hypothetical protein
MRLLEKQFLFTRNLSRLIRFACRIADEHDGFIPADVKNVQLTMGRAYASAAANKADKGIEGSCHTMRLAIDLNLFVNGEYITGDHWVWSALGRYWINLDRDENRWGGNFRSRDWNHFSMRHRGKQ